MHISHKGRNLVSLHAKHFRGPGGDGGGGIPTPCWPKVEHSGADMREKLVSFEEVLASKEVNFSTSPHKKGLVNHCATKGYQRGDKGVGLAFVYRPVPSSFGRPPPLPVSHTHTHATGEMLAQNRGQKLETETHPKVQRT